MDSSGVGMWSLFIHILLRDARCYWVWLFRGYFLFSNIQELWRIQAPGRLQSQHCKETYVADVRSTFAFMHIVNLARETSRRENEGPNSTC
jgi:hypothetical protein